MRKRNGNALNTGNVQKLDRIPFDHFDFNLIGMSAKVGRSYTTFFWSSVTTGYAHFLYSYKEQRSCSIVSLTKSEAGSGTVAALALHQSTALTYDVVFERSLRQVLVA